MVLVLGCLVLAVHVGCTGRVSIRPLCGQVNIRLRNNYLIWVIDNSCVVSRSKPISHTVIFLLHILVCETNIA